MLCLYFGFPWLIGKLPLAMLVCTAIEVKGLGCFCCWVCVWTVRNDVCVTAMGQAQGCWWWDPSKSASCPHFSEKTLGCFPVSPSRLRQSLGDLWHLLPWDSVPLLGWSWVGIVHTDSHWKWRSWTLQISELAEATPSNLAMTSLFCYYKSNSNRVRSNILSWQQASPTKILFPQWS